MCCGINNDNNVEKSKIIKTVNDKDSNIVKILKVCGKPC